MKLNVTSPTVLAGGVTTFTLHLPAVNASGYVSILLTNPDTGSTEDQAVYYTSACISAGMLGVGLECRPCPTGGVCPGGDRLWPDLGYWNPPGSNLDPQLCALPSQRCQGGRFSACMTGYQGSLCGQCAADYYDQQGVCYACGDTLGNTVGLLALDAILVLLLVIALITVRTGVLRTIALVITVLQVRFLLFLLLCLDHLSGRFARSCSCPFPS